MDCKNNLLLIESQTMKKLKDLQIFYWNAENIFHPDTGGPRKDMKPSAGWTLPHYKSKVERICEIIKKSSKNNDFPPVICLSEVESARTTNDILKNLPEKFKFAEDTGFTKFLDNILIYDSEIFDLSHLKYHSVIKRSDKGDFLHCRLVHKESGYPINFYVCHFKSKYEGDHYTEVYRSAVCDHLQQHLKEQYNEYNEDFVVVGDFNDDPFSVPVKDYLLGSYDVDFVEKQTDIETLFIYNTSFEALCEKNPGTLYHRNKQGTPWMIFDQFFVSPSLLRDCSPVKYIKKSFRIINELTSDESGQPKRCMIWTNDKKVYTDGFSDHFPIEIMLSIEE